MTARLPKYAQATGLRDRNFTAYSFRVGTAVARAIARDDLVTLMDSVGRKSERVARKYTCWG